MKNNLQDAKVGDLIVDYVASNKYTRFLLILRIDNFPHENYDDHYDLNCIVLVNRGHYNKNHILVTHFHFRNDYKNVFLVRN